MASDNQKKGFIRGVEKMRGNLSQHHIAKTRLLSVLEEHQDPSTRAHKHLWGECKVACNAARFERQSPWRLAAFADSEGLAFTKQFFAIWPQPGISEFAIAAVLNSPLGNAFSFQEDLDRDNHIETLARLPIPAPEALASGKTLDCLARSVQALFSEDTLLADMTPEDWREERREALIRLDAAVLDAYGLDAVEQRKLLDTFSGHRRPVGFEFTGYFPDHFKDVIASFDIDHLRPRSVDPMLVCDYDNLLYLRHRINLVKGKLPLPDPGKIALGKCLEVVTSGAHMGEVTALNKDGNAIVATLKLNNEAEVEERRKWLDVLRAVAVADECRFRKLVGFPADLTNLANPQRRKRNSRPEGITQSAYHLKEVTKCLSEWY